MARQAITARLSEKAYNSASKGVYVFIVPTTFNKQQIAEAVAEVYSVGVSSVRTVIAKGKTVRFTRGSKRNPGVTTRKDIKKAYVTLVAGDSITLFSEPKENS